MKVLEISVYGGTCKELKQMRHFLEKLKCLEIVKIDVHQENNHGEYFKNRISLQDILLMSYFGYKSKIMNTRYT